MESYMVLPYLEYNSCCERQALASMRNEQGRESVIPECALLTRIKRDYQESALLTQCMGFVQFFSQ